MGLLGMMFGTLVSDQNLPEMLPCRCLTRKQVGLYRKCMTWQYIEAVV